MSTTTTETQRPKVSLASLKIKDEHEYDYDNLRPYVHPPETKEILPWAELVTLDLEQYDRPGGKEKLAKQLYHAVHHVGFFYVKNYGLSQEQVDQQFTLAKNFFELDEDEKAKYEVNYAAADYNGWRRARHRPGQPLKDNIEMFNFAKFTKDFEGKYNQPELLKAHLPEIETFAKALHSNVVLPLLRLFAIVLELPDEEYLVKQHTYETKSEDHFRYMRYHKRTPEEHEASGYGQTSGHTDLGTVTLLFLSCCRAPNLGRGRQVDLRLGTARYYHCELGRYHLASDGRVAKELGASCGGSAKGPMVVRSYRSIVFCAPAQRNRTEPHHGLAGAAEGGCKAKVRQASDGRAMGQSEADSATEPRNCSEEVRRIRQRHSRGPRRFQRSEVCLR